jgi:hypothetical protein
MEKSEVIRRILSIADNDVALNKRDERALRKAAKILGDTEEVSRFEHDDLKARFESLEGQYRKLQRKYDNDIKKVLKKGKFGEARVRPKKDPPAPSGPKWTGIRKAGAGNAAPERKFLYSGGRAPSHKCHKIIEDRLDGSKVMVKDTTTNLMGERVEDGNVYLGSDENVCVRYEVPISERTGYENMIHIYNFDPREENREND